MKISKSHGTSEFKELAVMRVRAGHSARAVAMELRLIEQTLRNRGKVGCGRHSQRCWRHGGYSGVDGIIKTASRECATDAGARHLCMHHRRYNKVITDSKHIQPV
jgi:hypothetical protein